MKKSVRVALDYVLDHVLLTILASAMVPGLTHAVIQYFRGEVSIASIWVTIAAGLIAATIRLSLKVREQSKQLEQAQTLGTIPIPNPILEPDGAAPILSSIPPTDEAEILAPYHLDTTRRWYPYTTNYLVGKIRKLTDVERESAIENDIGRCMRIVGEIVNVSRYDFSFIYGEGFRATITLPNGILVRIETKSEPWNGILHASKIGEPVEVIGVIKDVLQGGYIVLEVHELLPPMLRN